MRRLAIPLMVVVLVGTTALLLAQTGHSVSRTFGGSMDQVWAATEEALKSLGWDIDERKKAEGLIITDDEKVDFKDFGLYGEGSRHKLRVQLRPVAEGRTSVSVTREVWMEKRYLWVKERKPLEARDTAAQDAVFQALEKRFPVVASPPGVALAPAPPAPIAAPPPAPAPAPATPPPATEGGRGEFTYKVTYVVKGTAPGAMLTYRNPRGGTEQTSVRLPWETSFTVKGGEFVYISAQNEGTTGSITCEILLDGVSRTNATSSGAYVIAECSSAAGRN